MAKEERKLPATLELEFAIADESVNRNGWRLLIDGICTEAFEKNPVCVVQHDRWMAPVGRWTSLRKEKGALKGTLQFDRNDEEAIRLFWKYKDGFMNAVSIGVTPISESEDRKDLLPGQRYATITESELIEISLVTIPAYSNSVRLRYADGREYKASLITNFNDMDKKDEKTVEQLQAELAVQRKLNAENLIALHRQRAVVSDGEVAPLVELAAVNYDNVKKMLEARATPEVTSKSGKDETNPAATLAAALVTLHFDRGAITDAEKPVYVAAALADYEGTRKILEAKAGTQQAKDFVKGLNGGQAASGADERTKWTYLDWYKKDAAGLASMEKLEPDRHKALVAAFEAECKQEGIIN